MACSQRSKNTNCGATVRQLGDLYLPGPLEHVHQPTPGAEIVASIVHVAKTMAQENPFQSAGAIITDLIRENIPVDEPCTALPNIDTLAHNANYHRRKQRPKHPLNLQFDIQDDHIPNDHIRTNNDLEGWHNRLNSRGSAQMPFYRMVALLHDEASLVPIQVRLVSDNKLKRHQSATFKNLQRKIFLYWGQYETGDKSAEQLLRSCSLLYGPNIKI